MNITEKIFRTEVRNWMLGFNWTHLLTISDPNNPAYGTHGRWSSDEQGESFRHVAGRFLHRLSGHLFGRGLQHPVQHAAFLERLTRYGTPTYWHAHALLCVPESHWPKLHAEVPKQWFRLTRRSVWVENHPRSAAAKIERESLYSYSGSFDLQKIEEGLGGVDGACDYCTKQVHTHDLLPLMALPPASSQG